MRVSVLDNIKRLPGGYIGIVTDQPTPKPFPVPDPVPGYKPPPIAAQVIDESGKGLYAGWVFIDTDGYEITEDYLTDANGFFHYTLPDFNADKIFIHFYSTDEYDSRVMSFQELANANNKIVLKKKTSDKGISLEAKLSIAGLLLALATMRQRKKVGEIKKPSNKTLLLIGGGAVAVWYLLRYKPNQAQKDLLQEAKTRLQYLADEYGIVPSLPLSQFNSIVAVIFKSIDKCGTEENNIYRSIETLNNEADIYQLILSWGIKKYDGCFEGSLPFWTVNYTLPEAFASDLSSNNIYTVNAILEDKKISYRF